MQKLDSKSDLENPAPDTGSLSYEPEIKEIEEQNEIEKKGNEEEQDEDFEVKRKNNPDEPEIPNPLVDRQ